MLWLGLLLLATAAYLTGDVATQQARERRRALHAAVAVGPRAQHREGSGFRDRVVAPIGERLAGLTLRLSRGTTVETVSKRLLAAGLRTVPPRRFLALKGATTVGGTLLGLALGLALGGALSLALAFVFGALGRLGPDFALSSRATKRREEIQASLPDALDLLSVSVEAGLSFDAAIARLADELGGPLAEELSLALGEMRMGRGRHEALRSLAERMDAPELTGLVRAVVQADQMGIPLARTLRVQAQDTRVRRQLAAEETAMKAPVKMLFPTVLFIFPAMFIVVLGPALLNFGQLF